MDSFDSLPEFLQALKIESKLCKLIFNYYHYCYQPELNYSQHNIKLHLAKFLRAKNNFHPTDNNYDYALISHFQIPQGMCVGFTAILAFSILIDLSKNENTPKHQRDDIRWLFETINSLLIWDGTSLPSTEVQRDIERLIFFINSLQHSREFFPDNDLTDIHLNAFVPKNLHLASEFSITIAASVAQLEHRIAQSNHMKETFIDNVIRMHRLVLIASAGKEGGPGHITLLMRFGTTFLLYDCNYQDGVRFYHLNAHDVLHALFQSHGYQDHESAILCFRSFKWGAQKNIALNAYEILDNFETPTLPNTVNQQLALLKRQIEFAFYRRSFETIIYCLARGFPIDDRLGCGSRLIELAIEKGQTELVRIMIRLGASLVLVNAANETPVAQAVKYDRADIVSLLLEAGASPIGIIRGLSLPNYVRHHHLSPQIIDLLQAKLAEQRNLPAGHAIAGIQHRNTHILFTQQREPQHIATKDHNRAHQRLTNHYIAKENFNFRHTFFNNLASSAKTTFAERKNYR